MNRLVPAALYGDIHSDLPARVCFATGMGALDTFGPGGVSSGVPVPGR